MMPPAMLPLLSQGSGSIGGLVAPAVVGGVMALLLATITRGFARSDKTEIAQIEMVKGAVNANVDVIKSLQAQNTDLTARNASLDARRAEAEADKQRAMAALVEAEGKYKVLLGLIEDRKRRDQDGSAQPEEGGPGER